MTSGEVLTIDDKALQDAIGWHPHKAQQEILYSKARHKVISAGVRFGKSELCAYIALKYLITPGMRVWIVSLNYDMTKFVFNRVIDFAARLDKSIIKNVSQRPPQYIEFKERNSWIRCRSVENPASLMGEEIDLAIIDEAARMHPDIWDRYLTARLASRQGKSLTISTPFGQNAFYKRWLQAKEAEDSQAFHFETRDNPYFPIEEWHTAEKRLPQVIFDQEYKAIFLSDGAGVFRKVDDCIRGEEKSKVPGHLYSMGVDLGKYEDFTVLTIIDKQTHEVVAFDRFKDISWTLQMDRICNMAAQYGRPEVWLDSTGLGDPIYDELRNRGLNIQDFKFTNKSKEHLVNKLSLFIENGRISYPNIEVLIDELKSFAVSMTEGGRLKYEAPAGLHDDCVASLALAVWALPEEPYTGEVEPITVKPQNYK